MLIITWLIAWLCSGQDPITFAPAVNDWATALLICASIDLGLHFGSDVSR